MTSISATATNFHKRIVIRIEELMKDNIVDIKIPLQGMTSKVFFIKTEERREYAVKYGKEAKNDIPAYELLAKEKINIPVPKLYNSFILEECTVLIFEKISYPLLESIRTAEMSRYIPSMVQNLKKLHTIKFHKPRLLIEKESNKTWKEMMLSLFEINDWEKISNREGLDTDLIQTSVKEIREKIRKTNFHIHEYSFLHTDFNQRNLFIDPKSDKITRIIDWEEAIFGDPLYDFARIRMFIWHFHLGRKVVEDYYKLLSYTPEQKKREELYWLLRVIQYLRWYSEELSEFNIARVKLHQDLLRKYQWR